MRNSSSPVKCYNAFAVEGVKFTHNNGVTKANGSTVLAVNTMEWVGVTSPEKPRYITLEWLKMTDSLHIRTYEL